MRQLRLIAQNSRCSILFHLEVPGGRWQPSAFMASPLSAGGPQPCAEQMCWARSMHASIDVTNVYFTPRNHSGSARRASPAPAS